MAETSVPRVSPATPERGGVLPQWEAGLPLADSHCHLNDEAFAQDRAAVLARARQCGVRYLIDVGATSGLEANRRAVALAEREAEVFATVGIHPHEAAAVDEHVLLEIEQLSHAPKVVAIGETGLDFHYDHSPRPQQEEIFRRFIALARNRRLPLTVHVRDAYPRAAQILREEGASEVGGVIHCFTGSWEEAREFLDLGFFLSFSGVLTFKNAERVREAARRAPMDCLLIETDAPYLAPVPVRGRRNEPAFVAYTAIRLAEVRSCAVEEVAWRTTENTVRLFALPTGMHRNPSARLYLPG